MMDTIVEGYWCTIPDSHLLFIDMDDAGHSPHKSELNARNPRRNDFGVSSHSC